MTNLLAQISIVLSLCTNWTGIISGTNELGYVATNHTAVVTYREKQHSFLLLSENSNLAVWRPVAASAGTLTNGFWYNDGDFIFTNLYLKAVPIPLNQQRQ